MIKFFRRIRYDLLGTSKIGRYLIYAIGEVVLVVIGILIAVQINSMYQNNNRLKSEEVLLTQLREELIGIYSDLYYDLEKFIRSDHSHFKILHHLENNLPYQDSLCVDFYFLKQDEYIYPEKAVFGKIKEEGLDIIRNDSIRLFTQALYESVFPRISKESSFTKDISEYLDAYYLDHFRPNKNYDFQITITTKADSIGNIVFDKRTINYPYEYSIRGEKRKFTIGFVPLDFEALKKDTRFLMLLEKVDESRSYKIDRYNTAKEIVRILVRLIDFELESSF
jgi:hypothetical protein